MAKKCIPGIICIENMTLFTMIILGMIVLYLWMQVSNLGKQVQINHTHETQPNLRRSSSVIVTPTFASHEIPLNDIRGDVGRCGSDGKTVGDPLTNPYVPPIRCDAGSLTTPHIAVPVIDGKVPINVPTQRYNTQYSQVGILTKQNGGNPDILPLMGRQLITSRSNWQYYTVSGGGPGGNLQTKLPAIDLNAGLTTGTQYRAFRWLNWVGHVLIDSIELSIGVTVLSIFIGLVIFTIICSFL